MQKQQTLKYLALGDSYTIGEGVSEEERYPVQLVHRLQQEGLHFSAPQIIAKTGWKTGDLIRAMEKKKPDDDHDLVSLLIGVNNQYQRNPVDVFIYEFQILLRKAISLCSGNDHKKVLVLSIPDYGFTPFGEAMQEQISSELDEYNTIIQGFISRYGVWYSDITDISRETKTNSSLIADDNLHPSGLQYQRWTERIMENEGFINYLFEKHRNKG